MQIAFAFLLMLQVETAVPVVKEVAAPCTLLASADAANACFEASLAAANAELMLFSAKSPVERRRAQDLQRTTATAKADACKVAELLHLNAGAKVDVSAKPDICVSDRPGAPKGLVRVRLKDGKDAGMIGCVRPTDLRDPVAF